jgi:hypothetical protein
VEFVAFGEVQDHPENAEGYPEKEVLIFEGEGKCHAEKGAGFAESEGDDEAGLDVGDILLGDGTFVEAAAEGERKKHRRDSGYGEADYQSSAASRPCRAIAEDRLGKVELKKIRAGEEDDKQKQQLRIEQRDPDEEERFVLGFDVGFLAIHYLNFSHHFFQLAKCHPFCKFRLEWLKDELRRKETFFFGSRSVG